MKNAVWMNAHQDFEMGGHPLECKNPENGLMAHRIQVLILPVKQVGTAIEGRLKRLKVLPPILM
jgi:hypothetical protein